MIIDLRSITHDTQRFEFSLDADWWNSADQHDQPRTLDTPLLVRVEIYKTGERYILRGEIIGGFNMICDRCLESYHNDITTDFHIVLASPVAEFNRTEMELSEKDMQVGFINGEEMDLREIVREQIYLSLPVKSLCRENCLGLCPDCGANLNIKPCECSRDQGHPGFLKLKKVKIEGE
jgi:uncharacterized protein